MSMMMMMILPPLAQDTFFDFLFGASQHITIPSVAVLQTNLWKGLSQLTKQTPRTTLTHSWSGIVTVNQSKTDAQQGRSSPRQAEGDAEKIQYNGGKRP